MNATPTTKKVRLKRVESLKPGDMIEPARGLFTRAGTKIQSGQSFMPGPFEVDAAELDSSGMIVVEMTHDELHRMLWAPADSYAVLA